MDPKPLSTRTCFLLILLFGVATYVNTLAGSFQFDDILAILENRSLYPLDLGRLWRYHPHRFITNLSFVFNIYFAGFQTWSFHILNLLIHVLASWVTFKLTRSILRTPAMKDRVPPSQQDLFALVAALLFTVHPIQTQAVTYIVQRATSLATLFYLATLWMYLRARLENTRYYWHASFLMLAAMLTKEISFTLPFAILLTELCFFPITQQDPLRKKMIRWSPFAAFLLVIPMIYILDPHLLVRARGSTNGLPTLIQGLSRWNYLLTQFRVERTYLRLLFFPVDLRLIYDYRLSKSFADPDSWAAFSLLFSVLLMAFIFFKKNKLLSFGVLWFFLTLSVESSLIPIPDLIFEHRLYLSMFGFALFLTSLLWKLLRSVKGFVSISLAIILVLSGMTYARNEVWKTARTLFQDSIKKAPRLGICYAGLADAYNNELEDYKSAAFYYEKARERGFITPSLYHYLSFVYSKTGEQEKSLYYQKLIASVQKQERNLIFEDLHALALAEKGHYPEVVKILQKGIDLSPDNPLLYLQLGETFLKMSREEDAVLAFRKAIKVDPLYLGSYNALAFYYKKRGEEQKALDVLVQYFKCRRIHQPLFGSIDPEKKTRAG